MVVAVVCDSVNGDGVLWGASKGGGVSVVRESFFWGGVCRVKC